MRKSLIPVFLGLCMAALLFPNAALADFEGTEPGWAPAPMTAGTIEPSEPKGAGTQDAPYQITTAAELYWFAGLVNGAFEDEGAGQNTSACAVLMNDITINWDMDPTLFAMSGDGTLTYDGGPVPESFAEWTPIGNGSATYKGTFNGQGYTISGLYGYYRFEDSQENVAVGLFGWSFEGGAIQNV